jgi:UDP-N-acetylglucosamine 2-epimerase (non-hydrolysing)
MQHNSVRPTSAENRGLKVMTVFCTRPEAIKMAPVAQALRGTPGVASSVCVTGQHRAMLDGAMEELGLEADHDLDIMRPGQDLTWITTAVLERLGRLLREERPDWLLVHGDTTTAMAAALAGFYAGVKVGHVEAGLRSWDLSKPWPEEMNRVVVDRAASLLFAPTEGARDNLLRDNADPARIEVTGNTVVDAVLACRDRIAADGALRARLDAALPRFDPAKRLILVTGHRRESFGPPFEAICRALARLAARGDVEIAYPVHPNPAVQEPVRRMLADLQHVHLLPPQGYAAFVRLLTRAHLVLTDSGGVQEEAPSLGKPVLVLREVTERPEAVAAGTVELVGTEENRILEAAEALLDDPARHARFARAHNPYGDGRAAPRIVARLLREGA